MFFDAAVKNKLIVVKMSRRTPVTELPNEEPPVASSPFRRSVHTFVTKRNSANAASTFIPKARTSRHSSFSEEIGNDETQTESRTRSSLKQAQEDSAPKTKTKGSSVSKEQTAVKKSPPSEAPKVAILEFLEETKNEDDSSEKESKNLKRKDTKLDVSVINEPTMTGETSPNKKIKVEETSGQVLKKSETEVAKRSPTDLRVLEIEKSVINEARSDKGDKLIDTTTDSSFILQLSPSVLDSTKASNEENLHHLEQSESEPAEVDAIPSPSKRNKASFPNVTFQTKVSDTEHKLQDTKKNNDERAKFLSESPFDGKVKHAIVVLERVDEKKTELMLQESVNQHLHTIQNPEKETEKDAVVTLEKVDLFIDNEKGVSGKQDLNTGQNLQGKERHAVVILERVDIFSKKEKQIETDLTVQESGEKDLKTSQTPEKMPRRIPVKVLPNEERPVVSSPFRRPSRLTKMSSVPTFVTRRNSAGEASTFIPKATTSSSFSEKIGNDETQTKSRTRRSSLKQEQEDSAPKAKTRRTSVSKEQTVVTKSSPSEAPKVEILELLEETKNEDDSSEKESKNLKRKNTKVDLNVINEAGTTEETSPNKKIKFLETKQKKTKTERNPSDVGVLEIEKSVINEAGWVKGDKLNDTTTDSSFILQLSSSVLGSTKASNKENVHHQEQSECEPADVDDSAFEIPSLSKRNKAVFPNVTFQTKVGEIEHKLQDTKKNKDEKAKFLSESPFDRKAKYAIVILERMDEKKTELMLQKSVKQDLHTTQNPEKDAVVTLEKRASGKQDLNTGQNLQGKERHAVIFETVDISTKKEKQIETDLPVQESDEKDLNSTQNPENETMDEVPKLKAFELDEMLEETLKLDDEKFTLSMSNVFPDEIRPDPEIAKGAKESPDIDFEICDEFPDEVKEKFSSEGEEVRLSETETDPSSSSEEALSKKSNISTDRPEIPGNESEDDRDVILNIEESSTEMNRNDCCHVVVQKENENKQDIEDNAMNLEDANTVSFLNVNKSTTEDKETQTNPEKTLQQDENLFDEETYRSLVKIHLSLVERSIDSKSVPKRYDSSIAFAERSNSGEEEKTNALENHYGIETSVLSNKRRSSTILNEVVKAGSKDALSDHIDKVVDLLCTGIRKKRDVSIKVSVEYANQLLDSENEKSIDISLQPSIEENEIVSLKSTEIKKITHITSEPSAENYQSSVKKKKKQRSAMREGTARELQNIKTPTGVSFARGARTRSEKENKMRLTEHTQKETHTSKKLISATPCSSKEKSSEETSKASFPDEGSDVESLTEDCSLYKNLYSFSGTENDKYWVGGEDSESFSSDDTVTDLIENKVKLSEAEEKTENSSEHSSDEKETVIYNKQAPKGKTFRLSKYNKLEAITSTASEGRLRKDKQDTIKIKQKANEQKPKITSFNEVTEVGNVASQTPENQPIKNLRSLTMLDNPSDVLTSTVSVGSPQNGEQDTTNIKQKSQKANKKQSKKPKTLSNDDSVKSLSIGTVFKKKKDKSKAVKGSSKIIKLSDKNFGKTKCSDRRPLSKESTSTVGWVETKCSGMKPSPRGVSFG